MLARILSGYFAILGNTLRILALFSLCLICGGLLVYPLWRLASVHPAAYTVFFSILIALLAGGVLFLRLRAAYQADKRNFFLSLARFFTLAVGLSAGVMLVLTWHRLLALAAIILTIAIYGLLAFGLTSGADRKTR